MSLRPRGPVALVVVLLLAIAGGASAQKQHKDTRHGFSVKPPKGFTSVALNPTERIMVAKYQDEDRSLGEGGTSARFNMFTVSFLPWPDDVESLEEDSDFDGQHPWVLDALKGRTGYFEIEKDKTLKVGKEKCRELQLLHSAGSSTPLMSYQVLVPADHGIFIVSGDAFEHRFSKAMRDFQKAARTFKLIEREGSEERESELAQLSPQERFLKEQIDKLPPGWDSLRTDRYLFLFNAEKDFVEEMAEQIEAMRNVYEELYPPDEPIDAVSIVRVCNSRDEYMGYGGPSGSGGYWSSFHKELVFFDMRPRDFTLGVLNHEAFHQYIYYFYGELAPHSWYNEGHGDYFAGARMTRSYRITGFGDAPAGIARSQAIKNGVRLYKQGKRPNEGACVPLRDLMRFTQQEYYTNAGVNYAAGWAVVHMLREGKLYNDKWKAILPDYLDHLLAARHEQATGLMEEALSEFEERKEAGDIDEDDTPPSSDPESYYHLVNRNEVQAAAYETTFAEWSDDDWEDFEEYWLEYVEKV